MRNLLRIFGIRLNNRAMSNAIGVLMTLTATVAMTGGTVLIATSISTNQMSSENLDVTSSHVWYVNETTSIGGIILTNSGQTDVMINKITINGANCMWAGNESFIIYAKTVGSFPDDLSYSDITHPTQTIEVAGQPYQFEGATSGVSVKAGSSIALYIATPNNIMVYSMGQPVTVVVTTTQAIYSSQTNVESSI